MKFLPPQTFFTFSDSPVPSVFVLYISFQIRIITTLNVRDLCNLALFSYCFNLGCYDCYFLL